MMSRGNPFVNFTMPHSQDAREWREQMIDQLETMRQQLDAERKKVETRIRLYEVVRDENESLRNQLAAERSNAEKAAARAELAQIALAAERKKPDRNLYLQHVEQLQQQLAAEREEREGLKDANRGLCIESNERYQQIQQLREQIAADQEKHDINIEQWRKIAADSANENLQLREQLAALCRRVRR